MEQMVCVIRKFRNEDSDALVDLWKTVFPDDPPHNDPAKVINSKLAVDDLIFVAVVDNGGEDEIIGACLAGYDGHRGWLYAAAVAPDHRGYGVGISLINHATHALKQLGCIKLNLQVRESNKPVVAFYESLGFKVEERISMGKLI